ncbi:MAG: hypothetical protein II984_04280 [Clostridia bacterium]|nr:hypothetical protein [Clostridia bacterium]
MKNNLKKRSLYTLIVMIMVIALASILSFTVLADDLHKINEIELEILPPIAGNAPDRSFSSIELGHPDYKVVSVNWYKDDKLTIDDRLGIGSNENVFVGGHSYTVKIDLALKNTKLTEWDKLDGENKYANINAKINGQKATVEDCYPSANWDRLCVVYKFEYIPLGKVYAPVAFVNTPVAGEKQDLTVKTGNESVMYVAKNSGLAWYVNDNKSNDLGEGWRYMQSTDTYEAGKYYRVVIPIQTQEGFVFDQSKIFTLDENEYINGYINGKQASFRFENDQRVEAVFDIKCQAKEINSVVFRDILAPAVGQHPNYNISIDMDNQYSQFIDENYTSSEYGFVNGLQWRDTSGILNSDSVFEAGGIYTLSFAIKANSDYIFNEWLEASSNIGYASAMVDLLDPSFAFIDVQFAPCGGGAITEVHIGGITKPVTGATPDFDITSGEGYELFGNVRWYDMVDDETAVELDANSRFQYGHKYGVMVDLKVSEGFTFVDYRNIKGFINGKEATHVDRLFADDRESQYVTIGIIYDCEKATILNQEISVEIPLEGSKLPTQVTVNGDIVEIVGFMWLNEEGTAYNLNDYIVEEGKLFTFNIVLSAKEGYKFDLEKTKVTINGESSYINLGTEDAISVVISIIANNLPMYSISFAPGEGAGSMDGLIVKDTKVELPVCEFNAPDGKKFSHWEDANGTKYLGEIQLTAESLELTAIYVEDSAEHTHIYGDFFNEKDATQHWKKCLDEDCPDLATGVTEQGNHNYDNDCDIICNDCGYERSVNNAGNPLHFYETECSPVCPNCGLEREVTHTPGEKATCQSAQSCTVCGTVIVEKGEHVPGEEPTCGAPQKCTLCDEILAEATGNHTAGAGATCTEAQKCTVCGIELSPALGHSFGVEYLNDENGHYKLCACGEKSEVGTHADSDGDKKCDTCGYNMSKGLSTGAIIGIVIGVTVVLCAGAFAIWFVLKKKKAQK